VSVRRVYIPSMSPEPPCFVPSSAPSLVPCPPCPEPFFSSSPSGPPSNARDSEVTQKIFDGRETLREVTSTTAVFIVTRAIDHRSVSWNNADARARALSLRKFRGIIKSVALDVIIYSSFVSRAAIWVLLNFISLNDINPPSADVGEARRRLTSSRFRQFLSPGCGAEN